MNKTFLKTVMISTKVDRTLLRVFPRDLISGLQAEYVTI